MKNLIEYDKKIKGLTRSSQVAVIGILLLLTFTGINAQSLTGSTWDLATSTPGSGYTNWPANNGVISLTDTTTGATNTCRGSAVTETSGYNPATNFSQCFKVFFGCPGNDQIGTLATPYTDQNGDGMAFSFWKSNATYTATNGNTCGGGLGYDNALTGGDNDGKMITIEFDTYSSLGTNTVDGSYGGGAPGSGINDEISIHKDQNSNDGGLITAAGTVSAGNLEDGQEHTVCITYNATTHILTVNIDGGGAELTYDLGATYNLNTYFGGATLNYTWSAGEYGATNLQTIGPAGSNIFGTMGRNPCTGVVMPVSFLSFSGVKTNEVVILNWSTATELNNEKFIIERSNGNSVWQAIGEVEGAGTSTLITDYNFVDYAPLQETAYYRLRQVDFDGAAYYSNVIAVQTGSQSVSIMPNPFDDALTISADAGKMNVKIHDVLGKLVYEISRESNDGTLNIAPELHSGAYIITVQTETSVEQQRIIRK